MLAHDIIERALLRAYDASSPSPLSSRGRLHAWTCSTENIGIWRWLGEPVGRSRHVDEASQLIEELAVVRDGPLYHGRVSGLTCLTEQAVGEDRALEKGHATYTNVNIDWLSRCDCP